VRWTCLCHSEDGGLNWSAPLRIHAWSVSPFPLLLADGRIVVVYMRRFGPTGLYAIVSEDAGESWSEPLCLRDDTIAAPPRGVVDGGYPLALEMDDGRIFVAYYWQQDDADVPWHGGRLFIGGTYFKV
jgi:sialidase-1